MNPQPVMLDLKADSEPQSASHIHLHGSWLIVARIAWLLISLSAVGLLITALVWNTVSWWHVVESACDNPFCRAHAQVFGSYHLVAIYYGLGALVEMLPWVFVGAVIFWRKSDELFALLFSLGLVLAGVFAFDTVVHDVIWNHFPAFRLLLRLLSPLDGVLLVLWYRFPDGKFALNMMRWPAGTWIMLVVVSAIFPNSVLDYQAWPASLPQIIVMMFALSLVVSLLYRYRRVAGPVERQQIRWVVTTGAFYGLLFAPSFLIWQLANAYPLTNVILKITYLPLLYIGSATFAVGIGISILRYHLWDIDIIINRALVYGGLTALVIGVYVLVVGALGTIMQSSVNWLVSILATGLIAVLVQPLRDRLQRAVNRMMYGERDDPITVLSRLGQRLEAALAPDAVLPSLVETVGQTLKLPYVAIELGIERRLTPQPTTDSLSTNISSPTIFFGQPRPEVVRFPLVHQSETIGQLLVAPRAAGESLSPLDRHLLENIARQAGMAVHAVSLTNELQQARQRLVTAVEEERRRLRRDLHDGLGPALASQGLKLAAAKQLLKREPESVASLLDQVMIQNQETVSDIRRLVYGLRPPVLDERGLAEAIRDHVLHSPNNGLQVEVGELPRGLPPLPAAVEVAAYRIALEALTNVIRHARARRCSILFSLNGGGGVKTLRIEIVDDGIGLPRDHHAGVGLRSMRERAEELGGTLTVESMPRGGTCILATLPLAQSLEPSTTR